MSPRTNTQRIVIAGWPRAGKSTYANEIGRDRRMPVLHTDDLIVKMDWSACSEFVAREWMTAAGPWIIEGVAAARALRKALAYDPKGKPCDVVVNMTRPFAALTPHQATMAKGCDKVWREVEPLLRARGVIVAPG